MSEDAMITVSLGPAANSVTAHLLNLEGLTGTSSEESTAPLCRLSITHGVSSEQTWVPRVLFVDEPHAFDRYPTSSADATTTSATHAWSGGVDVRDRHAMDWMTPALNNNDESPTPTQQQEKQRQEEDTTSLWDQFHSTVTQLDQQRYHAPTSSPYTRVQTQDESSSRHYNWDDDEEEEEEEEEDEISRERIQLHKQRQAVQKRVHFQEELNQTFDQIITKEETKIGNHNHWHNLWMPPHGDMGRYAAIVPPLQSSLRGETTSFRMGYEASDYLGSAWRHDILSEQLRHHMEECDTVKGFQFLTSTGRNQNDLYAGLTTSLLEECADECRSAPRMTISIHDDVVEQASEEDKNSDDNTEKPSKESELVRSFREGMQEGLALNGLASNSALYLPISLQNCTQVAQGSNPVNQPQPLWKASAIAAMALETATLPYRISALNDRKRSKVGLVSGYFQGSSSSYDDDDGYATSPSLTWHEFVSTLKPSKESILELDVACSGGGLELNRRLLEGTSVEQKRLEEQRQRSRGRYGQARVVEPGGWLNDPTFMKSLSPTITPPHYPYARNYHRHFALSTALRPDSQDLDINATRLGYTTLLMEGMGIRYRPEVSLGAVVLQSISSLVNHSGSGLFYKRSGLMGAQTPSLTVLGNSTRSHGHLHSVVTQFTGSLKRPLNRGYLARDVMAGLLPEAEDCNESLEYCLNVRDAYEPPDHGDGTFHLQQEGTYFSEITD